MGTPAEGIYIGTRLFTDEGYLVIEEDGRRSQLPIADILRAVDIPMLTHLQVQSLTVLANLVVVLTRTLIARDVLDEQFLEDNEIGLGLIVASIEAMGGDYSNPNLNVT